MKKIKVQILKIKSVIFFLFKLKNFSSSFFIDSRSSRMKNEENFVILFFYPNVFESW